jgi:hypothetical protein
MDKKSFYEILCSTTPEELNELLTERGKKKMVNGITFIDQEDNNKEGENKNGEIPGSI